MQENDIDNREKRVEQFLKLAVTENRGKLKIYIGMSAGVGKTYRMLQEAHSLLRNGVNIKIGICRNTWKKGNAGTD